MFSICATLGLFWLYLSHFWQTINSSDNFSMLMIGKLTVWSIQLLDKKKPSHDRLTTSETIKVEIQTQLALGIWTWPTWIESRHLRHYHCQIFCSSKVKRILFYPANYPTIGRNSENCLLGKKSIDPLQLRVHFSQMDPKERSNNVGVKWRVRRLD